MKTGILYDLQQLLHEHHADKRPSLTHERTFYIVWRHVRQARNRAFNFHAIRTKETAANIDRLTIQPATYIGMSCHMQEYAQNAMTYVCNYGRPVYL